MHLELPANAYAKHGTSQPVKIMVLEKVTGTPAEMIRCTTLADAPAAITAKTAPSVSAPVPRTASLLIRPRGRSSRFGGLASKPRLSAPPAKGALSQTATPIDYTVFVKPLPTGESVGVYLPYRPSRIAIGCASAHPTALVESIAMASITAPRPIYVPTLPQAVVYAKALSDAQLETLIYAGDAFGRNLLGLFKSVEEGLSIASPRMAVRTGPASSSVTAPAPARVARSPRSSWINDCAVAASNLGAPRASGKRLCVTVAGFGPPPAW